MKLDNLTLAELSQLLALLPAAIKRREVADRKAVIAEMRVLAAARGFNYDELVGAKTEVATLPKKPRKPARRAPNRVTAKKGATRKRTARRGGVAERSRRRGR